MDTAALINACLSNEAAAQRLLYETYLPYVLTIVRRYGIREAERADVIQNIFIAVFGDLFSYNPKRAPFKNWISTISVRRCIDALREADRLGTTRIEAINLPQLAESINLEQLDAEYIVEAIAALPDGYRTVFNLYVVEGYDHREIGEMLGISPAGSRSQFFRARRLLQQQLRHLRSTTAYGTTG